MKHIVHKAYWDYEKEEKWLNKMSAMGFALTDYSWCRYVFTVAPKNEYTYRIELLKNKPTHPESIAYITFLEENGVECVASYFNWIYLRKKTADGPFDIYTDLDSKINHYKRIYSIWNALMWMELIIGVSNLIVGSVNFREGYKLTYFNPVNIVMGSILILIGIIFLKLCLPLRRKIIKLKQEKIIRE
jgi:hypothetical protein